ncbi:MAG TPA: alkaline phosphatase [Bryobacteraceae bacterium]|nr:alkaline phosphatase [Bryobacteraceae bacterium]
MRRVLTAALFVCLGTAPIVARPKRARNVILFLADAGGVATLNAASLHGYNGPQKLFVQTWPHVGLSDTSPEGRWVTDSAAGMTAIVTGHKTKNGVISQAPNAIRGKADGTPLKTILEEAEERGLSTGVLSNVTITDATPAACYAHAHDRRLWGEIFLQLFQPRYGDGVDVLFGPGRKAINDRLQKLGYEIEQAGDKNGRPVYRSLGEVPDGATRALVVADGQFELNEAAKRAIRMLSSNRKGYFLMIESDAHTNNIRAGLDRLVAFDKLIREIAAMVGDDTLLLFTADHSFDFRVFSGGPDKPLLDGLEAVQQSNSMRTSALRMDNAHTAEEVVVAARGPGAERIRGFLPNTALYRVMREAFRWR